MYVPPWLGYVVPRQTLDGLWGCLQAETDMWVGRLSKQRVSRPLQSTGHLRGVEADPHPGVESLILQHQPPWSSDLWVWTRATSCLFICALQMSKLSCQSPKLLGAFSVGLFTAPSTLVLLREGLVNRGRASTISLLEICSPSSGESCWYKPRCSWSWVPSCAWLFSRQWAELEGMCRLLCGNHWRPELFSSWCSFPVKSGFSNDKTLKVADSWGGSFWVVDVQRSPNGL